MCRKTIFYSILSVCMVLALAFTAQAQVSIGVSIQPFPDAGSNPCTDQLVTNQVYNVTVYASNSSFNGSTANQIPVFLEGKVTENDACSAVGCPPGTEIPGAIGFLSCTPLDACISNCQETAPGTGIVTFDVAPGCLLLAAGQQFKPLVSIDKQALIPSLAGTIDCTLPSDYAKYNIAAKCIDNPGTQGVDCQVRDPQTGQTGTGSGTSEVYFPPAPCIDVTKDCEPDTGCIGTPITFSGTVTNCGDVDLINLNVSDNKGTINGGTCGSILPAGQSCTYSGVYTAPIVIGANTDTVTATGETTQGANVSDQASATCTKNQIPPSINVVKQCSPPQTLGGNIAYNVTVTNTTPLTCDGGTWDKVLNCIATDSNPDVVYNEPLNFTLNPGEVKTFTGSFDCPIPTCPETISVPNTFSVTCTDDLQQQATGSDDATCVCPCENPKLMVEKSCDPKSVQIPGIITLTGKVTNSGDVPINNINVTDNTGLTVTCPKTTLAVGESMNCTATLTCEEAGKIPIDTFTATGNSVPKGTAVIATGALPENAVCECTENPSMAVTKNCAPKAVLIPGTITLTGTITNTGNVALSNVTVTDSTALAVTCPKTTLAIGESMQCTASVACEQAGAIPIDTFTATAQTPAGAPVTASGTLPANDVCVCTENPSMAVTKTCSPPNQEIPGQIKLTGTITNTGNVPLSNVAVSDNTGLTVTCPKTTLAIGESIECTAFVTCEQAGAIPIDTFTATAKTPANAPVTASGTLQIPACVCTENLKLLVEKSCAPKTVQIPGTITLTGKVTNGSNVPISNIAVTDSTGLTVTCPKTTLAVGESMTCTATETCEQAGNIPIDTFTATGTSPAGVPVTASGTLPANDVCACTENPSMEVTKSCAPKSVLIPGSITLTGIVKNTGNVALSNVAVTDNTGLVVTCPKTALAPNESMTCTATETCEQVGNIAIDTFTATATTPAGAPVTASGTLPANAVCACTENPNISVTKNCTPQTQEVGGAIKLYGTVCNTGDVPLSNVSVTDGPVILTCTGKTQPFTLNAGECVDCETLVNCEQGGPLPEDTFTATGVSPSGATVSDTATLPAGTCECEVPFNAICRTPGFWGTHGGTEKPRSQNITQSVINAASGLQVCGESIMNTKVGCSDSALEAICVSVKGDQQRQLIRQLTAAALNCVMSGTNDCSGLPQIGDVFKECNLVCEGKSSAMSVTQCIGAIDCFNNGGMYKDGNCTTGSCSNNGKPCSEDDLSNCGVTNSFLAWINGVSCLPLKDNCHERELCNEDIGLCFEPPGPAGSSGACNKARKNSCYVKEGCSDCGK